MLNRLVPFSKGCLEKLNLACTGYLQLRPKKSPLSTLTHVLVSKLHGICMWGGGGGGGLKLHFDMGVGSFGPPLSYMYIILLLHFCSAYLVQAEIDTRKQLIGRQGYHRAEEVAQDGRDL